MNKRTILISINTSWNIFNFRRGLLNHLIQNGYKIIALAPKDQYSDKLIEAGFQFVPISMSQKGTNPFSDLKLLLEYRSVLKKIRPDVCLFYTIKPNIYGTLAASSLGIPCINNISGLGTVFLRSSLSSTIAKLLYRLALKRSGMVFFQNNDDKEIFESKGLINQTRSAVIPGSGIDAEYFKPQVGKKSGSFNFLMVSRLIFDKGIMEFLEAARKN